MVDAEQGGVVYWWLSYRKREQNFEVTSLTVRLHSHWHECRLRVIPTSETRTSGAFMVTHTSRDL